MPSRIVSCRNLPNTDPTRSRNPGSATGPRRGGRHLDERDSVDGLQEFSVDEVDAQRGAGPRHLRRVVTPRQKVGRPRDRPQSHVSDQLRLRSVSLHRPRPATASPGNAGRRLVATK